jgi:hypothetical protein
MRSLEIGRICFKFFLLLSHFSMELLDLLWLGYLFLLFIIFFLHLLSVSCIVFLSQDTMGN